MSQTKRLALCGVLAGLSVAVMWMIGLIPSMDFALPAVAGLLTLFAVIEVNRFWALGIYLVAGTLSFLLLPEKTIPLLYLLFFGYYPSLKSFLEQKLPRWLERILKMTSFNAAMAAFYFIASRLFSVSFEEFGDFGRWSALVMLGAGNVAFALYDFCAGSLVTIYLRRWQKKFRRLL
ncbi:MAG: hypothetical protein LBJ11_02355 [Oscillospiraceae bacterium]|nr:hypothetical protein [Oscillospiraceae bacterium]